MLKKLVGAALAVAGGAVAVALAGYAAVWFGGERILAKKYDIPGAGVVHATEPQAIAEGERLARMYGCLGCHEEGLVGQLFGEARFIFRSTSPNLPKLAQSYSDDDFERAIRHGVSKHGRSVNGMPSSSFYDMRDEELAAILGFIRSLPVVDNDLPPSEVRILGRLELLRGQYPPEASIIDHNRPRRVFDFADPVSHGEYLAKIACTECHGANLEGSEEVVEHAPPDLIVAAAYPLDDFRTLMRTGVPLGGRELRLMGGVARGRFAHFTDAEINDLHAYLNDRASR